MKIYVKIFKATFRNAPPSKNLSYITLFLDHFINPMIIKSVCHFAKFHFGKVSFRKIFCVISQKFISQKFHFGKISFRKILINR